MSQGIHPSIEPLRGDIAADKSVSTDSPIHREVATEGQLKKSSSLKLISDTSHPSSVDVGDTASSSDKLKAMQYQLLANRQATVLKAVASFLDQENLKTSLMAVCEMLHHTFNCTRVIAGLLNDGGIEVVHISQQSSFDSRSGEVRLLKDAMAEACDQDQSIHFTTGIDASNPEQIVVESHRAVLSGVRNGQICTVPLCSDKKIVGALLLEAHNQNKWTQHTIELQKQIAETIAPMVVMHQRAELGLTEQLKRNASSTLSRWISPRHMAWKLSGAAGLLIILLAAFIPVTHEIQTSAELVSTERRLITSPILGYVDQVHVSVGDIVSAGQPLLDLDVRDLQLQAQQFESQIENTASDYRAAMASHDRKKMAIVQAQLDQVRSELELINSQISRATIVAPVDGMIVNGEIAHLLGAPVERGKTLLEMAPESNYEIQLLVNETDIAYVKAGQIGALTLKSSPFEPISFSLSAIHPIATVGEGRTRFRVDAEPNSLVDGLRPGQTGVAKVEAGKAKLLWTWTHRMSAWLKLKFWSWF
ncbi:MAG: efflux RND transporter periplasmic adaptor subunit [Granulosicoccaceae bacterium]